MLWNVRVFWPRCSRFLFNSYRGWGSLIVSGANRFLYSKEGVTQGDPLSMFMYDIISIPLISSLDDDAGVQKQVWYAYVPLLVVSLRDWFECLKMRGHCLDIFLNPVNVVNESCLLEAEEVFGDSGVNVVVVTGFLEELLVLILGKKSLLEDQTK